MNTQIIPTPHRNKPKANHRRRKGKGKGRAHNRSFRSQRVHLSKRTHAVECYNAKEERWVPLAYHTELDAHIAMLAHKLANYDVSFRVRKVGEVKADQKKKLSHAELEAAFTHA